MAEPPPLFERLPVSASSTRNNAGWRVFLQRRNVDALATKAAEICGPGGLAAPIWRRLPHGLAAICCSFTVGASLAADVVVERVRMHEAPEHTRVVFEASGPVEYVVFQLADPERVVVDLNASLAEGLDIGSAARGHKRIVGVRTAPRGSGRRVVLDVAGDFEPRHFKLDPVSPYGHRLVVDLFEKRRGGAPPGPATEQPQAGKRNVIVAVDAGHGGEDPGAVGAHGLYEKTLVLQMARKLAARFNATPGYSAVLVRTGDYYIPLRKRIEIARRKRADMFISVHADAFKSPAASGASVYALSQRGATSETARWLAEKENRSDLIGGVGNVSLGDKDDVLAQVLLDLSMDANLAASLEAGEAVLEELGNVTKLHSRKVGQAGFVVLKSPDIPSLLVETGYISNPREARRLSHADHQHRIVGAIHAGVTRYMRNSPPAGTLLAARQVSGEMRYVVERGDTLSEIAERHGTSTARLRQANGLRGDRIRAGQVIVIPVRS